MTDTLLVERAENYTPHEHEPRLLLLESVKIEVGLDERVLQGIADVEDLTPLPMQLIEKYVRIAARHAILKRHPDGWFATVRGFQGAWAKESTRERAVQELEEVLLDWVLLKIEHRDRDLPEIEDINLNVL